MGNSISFIRISDEDYGIKIVLASYLRINYVDKSIAIKLNPDKTVKEILFMSSELGTVEWINGTGIANCHRWEDEEMAKSQSYLTQRYTSILMDGEKSLDFATGTIIPGIIKDIEDRDLAGYINSIISTPSYTLAFNMSILKTGP